MATFGHETWISMSCRRFLRRERRLRREQRYRNCGTQSEQLFSSKVDQPTGIVLRMREMIDKESQTQETKCKEGDWNVLPKD